MGEAERPAGFQYCSDSINTVHPKEVKAPSHFLHHLISKEIGYLARFFEVFLYWKPRPGDPQTVFNEALCARKKIIGDASEGSTPWGHALWVLNGTLNHEEDILELLKKIHASVKREDRIAAILYNPYLRWIYQLLNKLGLRKGLPKGSAEPYTFLTRSALDTLCALGGFEIVRVRPCYYFPFPHERTALWLNNFLSSIPVLRWFSWIQIVILRPIIALKNKPKLSVIITARNERGNIENALKRLDSLREIPMEIVFAEGHSNDGTWEEILRVAALYRERFEIQCLKQTGKGKGDAVRLAFSKATGEVLTILDGDLTMPPEQLPVFYQAYLEGKGDFLNGNRLVYPMEDQAMRFLNILGNIFFSKLLSVILDIRLGDTLCGTKMLSREDYKRMVKWREQFGDFDPFGDFELLFPAAELGIGIRDLPIRYRNRVYGTSNISRFRDGWLLLRMCIIGFFKIRVGKR